MWVRYIGIRQRRKDFGLPQYHTVAARPQVPRPASKHIRSRRPGEPQHDVLGSAGDTGNVFQRALAQPLLGHPFRDGG